MYTGKYILPLGDSIPLTGFCNHDRASFERDLIRARILKRKCAAAGKVLAPAHLLPHIHIYALADYFDMEDLKGFAGQGVMDVLHVYWNDKKIKLRNALDLAFTTTPDEDLGVRQPLIDILFAHPGLWVDDGDVRSWLEDNADVFEEVDRKYQKFVRFATMVLRRCESRRHKKGGSCSPSKFSMIRNRQIGAVQELRSPYSKRSVLPQRRWNAL